MSNSVRPDRMDEVDRWFRAKIGPTSSVAYTGTQGRIGPLEVGLYRLSASTDCYIRQGSSSVAATSSDYPLFIGQEAFMMVDSYDSSTTGVSLQSGWDGADDHVSGIRQTADGTLYASLLSRIAAASA
jgi:hypothetical protein